MEENKIKQNSKKKTKKTSTTLIIIGAILIIIGVIVTISAVTNFKAAKDNWWNNNGEMPGFSETIGIPLGVFILFIGIAILLMGLIPYMTKIGNKLSIETLDYAGKDITEVGIKAIDVAKPVINKGVDEVIAPTVSKIIGEVKNAGTKTNRFTDCNDEEVKNAGTKVNRCPDCNDEIEYDEEFCSNCGKRLNKKCSNCGTLNNTKNKFCKKCGNSLSE